ncbi:DUF2799 domain-containing protein [Alteromonas gracilis]|uniref:DUF2799 domain-containing protein n=1 Tax=Alteromonas gracilis TaxID=1479524 RepID=UPI0030CBB383
MESHCFKDEKYEEHEDFKKYEKVHRYCFVNVARTPIVCQRICLGKAQCVTSSSWEEIGFTVATDGKPATEFYALVEACDQTTDETQETLFVKGYMAGIKNFCTYDNGYQLGLTEETYPNVCPSSMADNFMHGFKVGMKKQASNERAGAYHYQHGNMHAGQPIHASRSVPFSAGSR